VSIVTPFLDAGRFIEEAIESVLAQTFESWELLLVDDGSSDGSTEIAMRYAAARPAQIRYLSHPMRANRGASASRNLGIRFATGQYLAFLDADDVYLPRKLEEQVRILDAERGAQVLYAATEYWHGWSGLADDRARDWIWRPHGVGIDQVIAPPHTLVTFLRHGGTVPCMGSVLVRREAVGAVGGWEESFRRICTDQVFHAKLTLQFPVLFADACWDRYRQHPDSACQKVAAEGQTGAAFETYLRWLESYLTEQRVSDPSVWSALEAALHPYEHPLLHRLQRRARRHGRQVAGLLGKARSLSRSRLERR
jgi:glycosyltransferase involved in cell wall biosynthesis